MTSKITPILFLSLLAMLLLVASADAQTSRPTNYDESLVPDYVLPELLVCGDGTEVDDVETWIEKRRPEIMQLFEEYVYGKTPAGAPDTMRFDVVEVDDDAIGGVAIRKQVTISFWEDESAPKLNLLVYLPKSSADTPCPMFLGPNFGGNHTITSEPEVPVTTSWVRDKNGAGNVATEASRGAASSRWPVADIVARGYGVATYYYGDIDPDYHDGFQDGIHPQFYGEGQTKPDASEWGSIGAWAWGLSRALDYLETDNLVNAKKVAVLGHSRLGKTALWAGAQDERFAIVISNNSGCGGAALHRRAYGEMVGRINGSFPHWFCDNFNEYNDNEGECPVDQHMLIALMAPRPCYVASALEDRWADPRGEFLSAYHAGPAYELFGLKGVGVDEMPEVDEPASVTVGYHVRSGGHDVKDFDWEQYMNFADRHFNRFRVRIPGVFQPRIIIQEEEEERIGLGN
jgi:hypothetical protein